MMKKSKEDVSGAWYACAGLEQDIVVATRATLSRNLANFPFPDKLNDSESERIQSIVFDAFNFLKNAEDFQAISVCNEILSSLCIIPWCQILYILTV